MRKLQNEIDRMYQTIANYHPICGYVLKTLMEDLAKIKEKAMANMHDPSYDLLMMDILDLELIFANRIRMEDSMIEESLNPT